MLIFECKSKSRVSLLLTEDSVGVFYEEGRLEHVEINAGKDRSGTTWVLTKDGYNSKLQFQKGTEYGSKYPKPDKIFKKR